MLITFAQKLLRFLATFFVFFFYKVPISFIPPALSGFALFPSLPITVTSIGRGQPWINPRPPPQKTHSTHSRSTTPHWARTVNYFDFRFFFSSVCLVWFVFWKPKLLPLIPNTGSTDLSKHANEVTLRTPTWRFPRTLSVLFFWLDFLLPQNSIKKSQQLSRRTCNN